MDYDRVAMRRRRRRKRRLQKMIPVGIALALIAIIILVGIKSGMFESFAYSYEREELFGYFGAVGDDYAVVIDDGEITTDQLRVRDGHLYLDYDTVLEEYNESFYYDDKDQALLYTTADEVISAPLDSTSYTEGGSSVSVPYVICTMDGDQLLVALEYVQLHASIDYELCGGMGEPYRVILRREASTVQKATVEGDEAVRVDMDKKAKVLTMLSEGDEVIVLEQAMDWTKVQTDDMLIGYYETRLLGDTFEETIPGPAPYKEPEIVGTHKDYKINMIWDMVAGPAANAYMKDRIAGQTCLNTISPTWFFLADNEGTVESIATHEYVEQAHSMGMEVWGLVENITHKKDLNMKGILPYSYKRANIISQLIAYAIEYDLDGINLDFESLDSETGPSFIQFIRELSIECRHNNLVLSVDNYVPTVSSSLYNRDEQGKYADYIIIMGYDEHYVGSPVSGSVASLDFVIDGITKTLEEVPKEKVINAVPLYTRVWIEKKKTEAQIAAESDNPDFVPYTLEVQTIGMGESQQIVANAGASTRWDDSTSQNYAEWEKNGKTYKVWLEDGDSLAAKIQAMHSFDIAGISAWQSSYANKEAWEALAQF